MPAIIGITGSLRQHPFNAGLLRAAVETAPAGCGIRIESGDYLEDFDDFASRLTT